MILEKRKIYKAGRFFFFMLDMKRLSSVMGKAVYTDNGELFGEIEDVNLVDNKIDGWRIRVGGGVMNLLGGARGVIIPHTFVKAIGDIFIISKTNFPQKTNSEEEIEEVGEITEEII